MTALPTLCLRSHAINWRRPSALLGNVPRRDSDRMHASTLSLATSIPTTTRSLCAIIQLPSLLGPGSKPMQLFGLRKTPDLSHAPRQALGPMSTNGLRSSDGRVVRTARSHILADFADTRARRKPLTPSRREGRVISAPPV